MSKYIEELDYQKTPIGELVLRRRRSPSVPDEPVYEVKVNDEMLMSSSINASERALATLALEGRRDRSLDVLVGGLGLGYTAAAALEYHNVRQLVVLELLAPVIDWHRRRLVPLADALMDDPRCSLVEQDFFEHVGSSTADRQYDAILLDIDHSPDCWLQPGHQAFYSREGLLNLVCRLRPGGVFAIWSAWKVPGPFIDAMGTVFPDVREHEIAFYNPHISEMTSNWIVTAEGSPR